MPETLVCEALIFDLDGVLVDSSACITRIWTQWANRHSLDPAAVIAICHGLRTVDTIRKVAPHLDAEQEAVGMSSDESGETEGVFAIDGATQLVGSLPAGRWAVATSGSYATATTRLKYVGLPIPAALVTATDVQQGKPHPDPFLLAARRMGIDPTRCIVVEDAPAGVQAGHAAGMKVIAVATTHQPAQLSEAERVVVRLSNIRVTVREDQHLVLQT